MNRVVKVNSASILNV